MFTVFEVCGQAWREIEAPRECEFVTIFLGAFCGKCRLAAEHNVRPSRCQYV